MNCSEKETKIQCIPIIEKKTYRIVLTNETFTRARCQFVLTTCHATLTSAHVSLLLSKWGNFIYFDWIKLLQHSTSSTLLKNS